MLLTVLGNVVVPTRKYVVSLRVMYLQAICH